MTNENSSIGRSGEDSPFEQIKRVNAAGNEYWSSRDFARVLGYVDYRNFEQVIDKAKIACFNSGQRLDDHFVDITDMVTVGSGAQRPVPTTLMSRYANRTHFEVGRKVRKTIEELGGTMPENLPPASSIKKLESKKRKQLGDGKAE